MSYTADGLVLRVKTTGENDKLLTLLTPLQGKITVLVKGGRSLKSGSLSATQLFSYGNYGNPDSKTLTITIKNYPLDNWTEMDMKKIANLKQAKRA